MKKTLHAHCCLNCFREIRDADNDEIIQLLTVRFVVVVVLFSFENLYSRPIESMSTKNFDKSRKHQVQNVQSKVAHELHQLHVKIVFASRLFDIFKLRIYIYNLASVTNNFFVFSFGVMKSNVGKNEMRSLPFFYSVLVFFRRVLYTGNNLSQKLLGASVNIPANATRENLINVSF